MFGAFLGMARGFGVELKHRVQACATGFRAFRNFWPARALTKFSYLVFIAVCIPSLLSAVIAFLPTAADIAVLQST